MVPVRCISNIRHMYTTDFAYDGPIFLVPLSPSYPSSPVITTTIRNNKHILTEKRFKCNMLLQYHGNYIEINFSLICYKLTLLEFLLSISHINLDSHHVLRFFCSPNLPCCQPGLLQCSDSLASAILLPRFWPGQMCPETERLKISTGLLSTYINYEIQCCKKLSYTLSSFKGDKS